MQAASASTSNQRSSSQHGITQKLIAWARHGGGEPHDRYDLFKMGLELVGRVGALRQIDDGRFDKHA